MNSDIFRILSANKLRCITFSLILILTGCSSVSGPEEDISEATIDLSDIRQLIRGFGGVNMPGWIDDMTPDMVAKAFGADDGQIGMTILRIRVPWDTTKFNLEVPTAQLANSLGAIIIASPWSPPPEFKTNGNIVGGRLKSTCYAAYADHLKAFADYMSANDAPLYAISLQNEPDVRVSYESCDWNAAEMLRFVKENASSIGVPIIIPESYNFNHTISDAILNDSLAVENIAIIGGHIYGGGCRSYPLAESKGKEVWMTEHLNTEYNWYSVIGTVMEIHDCMVANMNAYLWWYIRRFYGPIDDDGKVTQRGYVMSQFARFVRPGFYRVAADEHPQPNIYLTAYKQNDRVIIVAINRATPTVKQTFILTNGTVASFKSYVTSGTKNCVRGKNISVSDAQFTTTLTARSVTTFASD